MALTGPDCDFMKGFAGDIRSFPDSLLESVEYFIYVSSIYRKNITAYI